MRYLLFFLIPTIVLLTASQRLDFGKKKSGHDWQVIGDSAVGGFSKGELTLGKNTLVFKGTISTEGSGGFCSVRSDYKQLDLTNYEKLVIRFRATGPSFALMLEPSKSFYSPYFKHTLVSTSKDWQVLELNLADFTGHQMGKPMGRGLKKQELETMMRIGFINARKDAGPFKLEVDYLEFR